MGLYYGVGDIMEHFYLSDLMEEMRLGDFLKEIQQLPVYEIEEYYIDIDDDDDDDGGIAIESEEL